MAFREAVLLITGPPVEPLDMPTHWHKGFGLRIASEFEVPELEAAPAGDADVNVRVGAVPDPLPGETAAGDHFSSDGTRFMFRWPPYGRLLVTGPGEVVMDMTGRDVDSGARFLLIGVGLAVAMGMREWLLLHAGAVDIDGEAVVLCGPSGGGKSTTTQAFGQAGHDILTEEIAAVHPQGDQHVVVPAHPAGRLLEDAVAKLGGEWSGSPMVPGPAGKRVIDFRHRFATDPLPLRAVYELWPVETAQDIRIVDVPAWRRFNILRRHTYLHMMLQPLGLQEARFRRIMEVAGRVPVKRVVRPLDSDVFAVRDAILEDVRR